ncbi:MAG: 50S ribosomal protein L32 [Myxococcota bacterium]|jgi:large subunit ribosomal protein L32|nr:MAG: 50S ribosomal protein L32 [Deltaproteobacteria bacterium ADurb.Bin058]HHW97688.1 50S ribosomal protein L32 [Oligoflexales bacterium]HON26035.1 50S ribosomal protein L32 [Myxococcota bacterium]HOS62262.1 50S ribosomal protein L32 [Myxococcota bacterium]HPC92657.1 50S ribosomal protein L32 [Myxococcota bacterium]
MPTPKKKTSKSRRDMRRANHDKVVLQSLSSCSRCGEPRMPHRACPACGFYRDRIAVAPEPTGA